MATLVANIRYAIRSAVRQPLFTATVVLTLALGIGANTAMYATLRATLAVPDGFEESDRLVFAATTFDGEPNPMSSAPDFYDYHEQADQFESLAAIAVFGSKTTISGGEPERAPEATVSHDFFRMLRVAPAAGRAFLPDEASAGAALVVVVSERLAARRFGTAAGAVDRVIVAGGKPATIVGVMPASFRFLYDVDVWFPMRKGEGYAGAPRQFHNWLIFGRLKPGATLASARDQVNAIAKRLQEEYPATNRDKALALYPMSFAFVGRQIPRLTLLGAAVVLLLLIACANVAGLLMARGAARRGELAVRASLGASRRALIAQLLTESLLLAVVAGAAGALLAYLLRGSLPLAAGFVQTAGVSAGLSWPVLAFVVGLSVLTALGFGIAPALRSSKLDPARDLAPGARLTDASGATRIRAVLVAAQVALSLVLLVAAGLLARNLTRLVSADPGFRAQQLLTGEIQLLPPDFPTPPSRVAFFEALRQDLAAVPGVTAVGFTSHLPLRQRYSNYPAWPSDRPPASPADRRAAHSRLVLPGYFDALGIPILAGRDIATSDRDGAAPVMVINEAMARAFFPGRNPLGLRISVDRGRPMEYEVIGVVGNARLDTLSQNAPMTMYVPYAQAPMQNTMRFALRTAVTPRSLTETVRRLVAARSRSVAVEDLVSMDDVLSESLQAERVTTLTLGAFSVVALLLAAIGLYGVLAFSVSQRTHEIGVRIALGADARAVVWRVLGRTALMVGPGLALGLAGALAAARSLRTMLFEIEPTDPATLAATCGVLALAALAASALPAWRAAHIDPVRALRGE